MDIHLWWCLRAIGIFFLFNLAALIGVLIFHRKKWNIDVTQFRHYTSLVFQICGVVYALFLGFIVWDAWERFYDVKRTIQNEAKYLVDLYQDSSVLGEEFYKSMREKSVSYLNHVIEKVAEYGKSRLFYRGGSHRRRDLGTLLRLYASNGKTGYLVYRIAQKIG